MSVDEDPSQEDVDAALRYFENVSPSGYAYDHGKTLARSFRLQAVRLKSLEDETKKLNTELTYETGRRLALVRSFDDLRLKSLTGATKLRELLLRAVSGNESDYWLKEAIKFLNDDDGGA